MSLFWGEQEGGKKERDYLFKGAIFVLLWSEREGKPFFRSDLNYELSIESSLDRFSRRRRVSDRVFVELSREEIFRIESRFRSRLFDERLGSSSFDVSCSAFVCLTTQNKIISVVVSFGSSLRTIFWVIVVCRKKSLFLPFREREREREEEERAMYGICNTLSCEYGFSVSVWVSSTTSLTRDYTHVEHNWYNL